MILATHGVLASQIASFDADAQAFFNRVTTAGGSLTLTEKQAVNTLVVDMKAYGIWSAMKAVYPMVGASADACKQNLVSSSFTGTFSTGWTFASTGVTPNGTSAYMDTNLNPSTQLSSQDSNHLSFYSRTNSTGGGGYPSEIGQGADSGSVDFELFCSRPSPANTMMYISNDYNNSYVSASNGFNSLGFFSGSRTSSTSLKVYKNGVLGATQTNARNGNYLNCNIAISVLMRPSGTPLGITFSDKQCAFASIGDGLTDTQTSNFYTAVQAFQTTLSRQV